MDGAGFAETSGLQVLRHDIGRRQPDDPIPGALVCLADHSERVALAGPGPTLDQFKPAAGDRIVKRGALVGAQFLPV